MNALFSASLKRSSRTRTRKNSVSTVDVDVDVETHRKSRPPPLQIIPEMSENEHVIDIRSPATARASHFRTQRPERVTLSAYTFSIDDALLMFGSDTPRSPALSASSSTSDGASSEDVPATPGVSDDDDGCDFSLPTPRLRPQHISIRPLCITKTRSLICQEDEDIRNCFEKEEQEDAIVLTVSDVQPQNTTEVVGDELEHDFYVREFEDFISLSPVVPFTSPARRDSLVLVGALPAVIEASEPKARGRSRHSKPLPLLPPVTPPMSSFPFNPTFSLVQTTARNSVVRRKRSVLPAPSYPLPAAPVESRPLPRVDIPLDVEDDSFPEESFDLGAGGAIVTEKNCDAEEDACFYSRPSLAYAPPIPSTRLQLPPAISETPLSGMYGHKVTLPRSSIDSDAPRSSIDSTSSFASSSSTPASPISSPASSCEGHDGLESTERLRSRWSSSTLASLSTAEPPRAAMLLSPLKNVLGARTRGRRTPLLPYAPSSKTTRSKNKRGVSAAALTSSSLARGTAEQDAGQQGSRWSMSSAGTRSSSSPERHHRGGSLGGPKKKQIPVLMFLRAG